MHFEGAYNWYVIYIAVAWIVYVAAIAQVIPSFFIYVPLILAFIPIFYKALEKLREKKISTELFLIIATGISLIGHQEKAMSAVLLIMLIAEYLEYLVSARMEKEIKSLMKLMPKRVLIKENNREYTIDLHEVRPGMLVIVKTGTRIPVDGLIMQGNATINEASLTGESIAKEKIVGQEVYAGTFIESGSIIVKAEKIGEDTFFGKITALVEKAEQKKARISIVADKIASYLVPTLLFFIGITWLLTKNLNLVTTLLVFGSPLELTLITPLAILSGIIAAFRHGILVKGGLVLEKLARADTMIFDKTGTLTMGEPEVTKIESFSAAHNEVEVLKIAAIAEKRSDHILAQAILKKAQEKNITIPDPENYVSVSGHGVEIRYRNETCFLGNRHFVEAPEHGNITISPDIVQGESQEYSVFYIGCSGKLYGRIFITDKIREDAKQTISDIKKLGFTRLMILSGDRQIIADRIAEKLGIFQAYGEVFPDQKLQMIEELQNSGHLVAMVGDGINDAPALKQADVGIALGAMGMEPAIEAADIVLVTNDLSKIVFVCALSKKIFSVIKQNLIFGFALIHGIGIILTFMGFIDPLRAALFHGASDILILLNSVRLMNFK